MKTLFAADLFAGAGGFSTGLIRAAAERGIAVDLLAVNHWPTAIETHSANHPAALHYCESIEGVSPKKVVPGGHLDILLASPSCVHHSNARGGRPMNDQERSTAWHILRWAEELYIENILIENVREFRGWGPLHGCTCGLGDSPLLYGPHTPACKKGRPIQALKGKIYRQFLSSLRALGYTVSERILNAADYGEATTRQRLFIQAKRGKKAPQWPIATHTRPGDALGILEDVPKWRPAREIIDWSLPSQSIYNRKKPLKPNTMRRILAGIAKYSGMPFVVGAGGPTGAGQPQSVELPLGTILTQNERALVEPFLVVLRNNCDAQSLDRPLPALCASGGHFALCETFVLGQQSCATARETGQPLPTIATAGAISLVETSLARYIVPNRTHCQPHSAEEPLRTLTTGGNMIACESFVRIACESFVMAMEHSTEGHERRCYTPDRPLPTVTGKGMFGVVDSSFLVEYHGGKDGDRRTRSVEEPLPTQDTSNRVGCATSFFINYHGNGQALSLDDPLDTIDTRDRFALVSPELVQEGLVDKGDVVGWLDIRFRMLQWRELADAMGFPADYQFAGNQSAKVKQVGNAVSVRTAEALCGAILDAREGRRA